MGNRYEPLALDRVIWGEPWVHAALGELADRGASRPLVVVSPNYWRLNNEVDSFVNAAGPAARVFDDIVPHVPRESVMALIDAIRTSEADIIVAVGGGSVIDTVKVALAGLAAGIVATEDLDRLAITVDAQGNRLVPALPPPPIRQITVPTTLSGAEFSDLAGCTDAQTQVKQLFTHRLIGSATVILDPATTLSAPLDIWLSTGVRAIDHAVESVCSSAPNLFVDALSLEALRLLPRALLRTKASPDDLSARLDAQLGVWLACSGLNRVPWGASHGLGHQLGAISQIPHGFCSCILLSHVLDFNRSANEGRQRLIEDALDADALTAGQVIAKLVAKLELPRRIRDVGVAEDRLPEIARTSMSNMFVRQNPRPIGSEDDLLEILTAAY